MLILSTVLGQFVDFYRNWPWSGGNHLNKEHEGEIPRIPRRTEQSVGELRVTEVMVKKVLLSLNINKSSGPDKINPRILIELAEYIAGLIAFLFNMTMNHGVLPRD